MKAHGTADEGHPVIDVGDVDGLSGLWIFFAGELNVALLVVNGVNAGRRRIALIGIARNDARLPFEVAVCIVVARVLLGKVDVDIGTPIGLACIGVFCSGLLGGDVDIARLLVGNGVLDHLGEGHLVADPAIGAAADGDLLAIRARVGALAAGGIELGHGEVVNPFGKLIVVERGVERVVEGDPLAHLGAVERSHSGSAHLEIHVDAEQLICCVAGLLELFVGGASGERLVGRIVKGAGGLSVLDGFRCRLCYRIGIYALARTRLFDGELAGIGVIGAGGIEGAGSVLVEGIDGGGELLVKGVLVVGCLGCLVERGEVFLGVTRGERSDELDGPEEGGISR